jgi:hypothetical protein
MICVECKKENEPGAQFCGRCGSRLLPGEESPKLADLAIRAAGDLEKDTASSTIEIRGLPSEDRINELAKYLDEVEAQDGPHSSQFADALDSVAGFYLKNKIRLAEAADLQARAKGIRSRLIVTENPQHGGRVDDSEIMECPFCAEMIKKKAVLCKHCKSTITAGTDFLSNESLESIVRPIAPVANESSANYQASTPDGTRKKVVLAILFFGAIGVATALGVLGVLAVRNSETSSPAPDTNTAPATATPNPFASKADEVVRIDRSFNLGNYCKLQYHIDRVERTTAIPQGENIGFVRGSQTLGPAPTGASYVLVHYDIGNRGTEPASTDWRTRFMIMTNDNDFYKFKAINDSLTKELQPGFQVSNQVAVFEIPSEHLGKYLLLDIVERDDNFAPFHFKDAVTPDQYGKQWAYAPETFTSPGVTGTETTTSGRCELNESDILAYRLNVRDVIKSSYKPPSGAERAYKCVYDLVVDAAGRISKLELKYGSGVGEVDKAVQEAISASVHYPPPPKTKAGQVSMQVVVDNGEIAVEEP